MSIKLFIKKKSITDDFSCLVAGRVYGTNSRTIYEKFCISLNWDRDKSNQFGWQTPLYAINCDTYKENDVWFIYYPNYDKNRIDNVVEDGHVVNLIYNNGDRIMERVEKQIGSSHLANRITFVKTKAGYEFLGVYKIIQNGTTRIYERISKVYPVKN